MDGEEFDSAGASCEQIRQDVSLRSKAAAYEAGSSDTKDIIRRAGPGYKWGKTEIDERGKAILNFIAARWRVDLTYDAEEESDYEIGQYLASEVTPPRGRRR